MNILERLESAPAGAPVDVRIENVSRRRFLQQTGGLALGLYLSPLLTACGRNAPGDATRAVDFEPDAFVRVGTDDSVTVIAKHLEMGQGTYTGLATLIAEELDADWPQVKVIGAPADAARYKNLVFGSQGTGGSTAMRECFEQMREAGAAARAMLVAAAAERWNVPAATIVVDNGVVRHPPTQRRARFGELAEAAASQPVPKRVRLKSPGEFKLIGRQMLPRKDNDKTDGSAIYTQDLHLPDMLVAVVAHPPRFWAQVKNVDDGKARSMPDVAAVVQFQGQPGAFNGGVAVLACHTWAAWQARDALQVEWDDTHAFKLGSREIFARYRELAQKPGLVARDDGDAEGALAGKNVARIIEAEYEFPYLAHASMEPLNCVVKLGDGSCEIWNGEQLQTNDQDAVAALLGIAPDKVTIHQLYAGGSFGRRGNPHADYVLEAVSIAKGARAQGIQAPVKLVWTREDDTRGGYYRPAFVHVVRAALDRQGRALAWRQRLVGQSIRRGTAFEKSIKNGIDNSSVEGASDLPYAIPNLRVELHTPDDITVPVQWWRSVGHTHTAYSTECMIDELAQAAGQDPYRFRRALLANQPHHRAVLDLAATKAGWERPLEPGTKDERRGRGIAVHQSFHTYVAEVAEVTVRPNGSFKVDRVVCAVDCGLAINPDVVRAQMEGGIGYGLSAALLDAITLEDGVVQQSNFDRYPPLRMNQMPAVEVHIVPSAEHPTGVGEPGVPPSAPAVANALAAATGQRLRKLPFDTAALKKT
ncbi:MAG: xanthine dehydrogenase family protein molybdopterin-binding subunit [Gammaproteobacteria bacterium]|nr:xanthine dehydrogenase family protein molybdopterin-binding subunit [Gammaproteobacteria bacterium]